MCSHHMVCVTNAMKSGGDYVQALLEAEDKSYTEKVRPCDVQEIIRTLKL
jgi:hypothetical protein